MTTRLRRAAAVAVAIACGLVLALTGTATADGRDDRKCVEGEATGDGRASTALGGVPFVDVAFTVCRTGPRTQDATGFFQAVAPLSGGLIAPRGAVTCADFQGDTVSFLYPLDEKSRPGVTAGTAILIVARDGGPAPVDDRVGFAGPLPLVAFGGNNCDLDSLQAQAAQGVSTFLPLSEGQVVVRDGA